MKRLGSPLFYYNCHLLLWTTIGILSSSAQPSQQEDSSLSPNTTKNPYAAGCLQATVPGWTQLRVCNSDDLPEHVGVLCRPSEFPQHVEVRIKCQDWESVTFSSWVVRAAGFPIAVLLLLFRVESSTLSLHDVAHFAPLSLPLFEYSSKLSCRNYSKCPPPWKRGIRLP